MILILLIIASINDIKKYEIPLVIQVLLFIVMLFNTKIYLFFLVLIFFIIFSCFDFNKIGGADIKILLILFGIYGVNILNIIIISSMIAIIYIIIFQKKIIPFVPFITLGVICQNLSHYQII